MLFLQTIHDLHWNKEYYEKVVFENRYIPLENSIRNTIVDETNQAI